jgi:phage baseplate assembly protein W
VRTPERIDPAVEECIERNVHDEKFESLGRRDARRKLRRLEVKADCEARVAAR